jgi:hypothetical protein
MRKDLALASQFNWLLKVQNVEIITANSLICLSEAEWEFMLETDCPRRARHLNIVKFREQEQRFHRHGEARFNEACKLDHVLCIERRRAKSEAENCGKE